jgi:hypothetical protein
MLSGAADKHQSASFFLFCGHRHSSAAGRAGRVIVLEGSCFAEAKAAAWQVFVCGEQVAVFPQEIPVS